ncbi:unnamed protein product [Dovyalis caffra]|uniref:Dof zinc finger protein n=1 Tax=Dovyalis caffra TaxID=77055 RepID=A0AAV1SS15_9ROSI|nr:unnamed protein product [Dovyalis caffra]
MQDPSTAFQAIKPQFPEQEQLKCPRCDSSNTKFCYYNNYNLSQPRHFCKNCKRYWTKGGALRNIPVGGGSRKNTKRSSSATKRSNPDPNSDPAKATRRVADSSSSTTSSATTGTSGQQLAGNENPDRTRIYGVEPDQDRKILDMGGSFSSLLASSGQFGSIFEGLNSNESGLKMVRMGGFGEDLNAGSSTDPVLDLQGSSNNTTTNHNNGGGGGESYLQSGEWGNSNGWPDLAIYTPGSSFQ